MATRVVSSSPSPDSAACTSAPTFPPMAPHTTMTSLNGSRSCIAAPRSRASPRTRPARAVSAPASRAAAVSACEQTSATWPAPGVRASSTSSSPTEITDTRGRGWTSTLSRPAAASSATCAAPITASRRTATSPGWTSSPTRRTNDADGTPRCTRKRALPPSVNPTGTTASASVGSGAPAATRTACPGCSRSGWRDPAGISPTTGSWTGSESLVPARSTLRTA
jgi:hypothetical protein